MELQTPHSIAVAVLDQLFTLAVMARSGEVNLEDVAAKLFDLRDVQDGLCDRLKPQPLEEVKGAAI